MRTNRPRRVLFVSSPGLGHLFPLIPLAWAFRAQGHEVMIAVAQHAERAAASGLPVVDIAPDFDSVAIFERVNAEHPEFATTEMPRPSETMVDFALMVAAMNRPLVDGVVALADDWKPDLVVYEQGATAGLFAAARAGVPAIQRNHHAFRSRGMHTAIDSFLTDLHEKYSIPSSLPEPSAILEAFPPSMLLHLEPEGWFMRWVPYGGGAVADSITSPTHSRPRVAVSLGTVELQAFGLAAIESIVAAAASVPADFVLALGDIDTAPLGKLPANVQSVGWVPLDQLFRSCDAAVLHGGGSMLTAIEAGIPILYAPDSRDIFQDSGREAVRTLGYGLTTTADQVTAELLSTLINDPQLKENTLKVREEMRSLPTPADIAQRILSEVMPDERSSTLSDAVAG